MNKYTYLLNEAKDLVNAELKEKFEAGEITPACSIFYEPTWLDVIQVFDYTKDFWQDHVINYELSCLLGLIRAHDISNETARPALRLIAAYILHTESAHVWNKYGYKAQFIGSFGKYYPANKPINYDYLRYVINQDIVISRRCVSGIQTAQFLQLHQSLRQRTPDVLIRFLSLFLMSWLSINQIEWFSQLFLLLFLL